MSQVWPLVGRDAERSLLSVLLDERRPKSGAVVSGEPGIGKSRLIEAVCDMALEASHFVAVAHARAGTASVPLGALLDVLEAAPPPGDDASLLWWVRNTLLQRKGGDSGLLLVLEDAHDADPLSLALCDHLVESGVASVVMTARSTEPAPEGLSAFGRRDAVEVIALGPLDENSTGRMAASIEGAPLGRATVVDLHRLSGGLPLAVREIVRAAAESGSPVSVDEWTWSPDLARTPGVESVLFERLSRSDESARDVVELLAAAGGSVPAYLATALVGDAGVTSALDRGLVQHRDGWLLWTHALLGEVSSAKAMKSSLVSARSSLLEALAATRSPEPREVLLAAKLDLLDDPVDSDLQLKAAETALTWGLPTYAIVHAEAAISGRSPNFPAHLVWALATIRVAPEGALDAVRRAMDAAGTLDEQLDVVGECGQLCHDAGLDPTPIFALIDEADGEPSGSAIARLEYLRTVVSVDASSPEVTLARSRMTLAADGLDPVERATIEGMASLMLATVGEIEEADALAASARLGPVHEMHPHNQAAGFYGGALAALFGGRGDVAMSLVHEGAEQLLQPGEPMSEVIHGSLRHTMAPFTGRAGTGMVDLVPAADKAGSLRYGVVLRLHATWELALLGDPRGDRMWSEIQDAPARLRQGPGFIEAFVAVARAASVGELAVAASFAESLAGQLGEARSAAAWLWFDCARHGEAARAVPKLEEIAATQQGRFFPAIAADAAAAIAARDPALLASAADDFSSRGFPLFGCELEVLASLRYKAIGEESAANRAATRAQRLRDEIPGTTTPILRQFEGHPLTDRQRVVCRLAGAGMSNQEIADRLVVSKRTVENHLHRAYAALGVDREALRDLVL